MEANAKPDKCPYSFMKGINGTEETVDTKFDTEKGIEMINPNYVSKDGKCPFGQGQTQTPIKDEKEKDGKSKIKAQGKDEDSDEEAVPLGGCPVMGGPKKDPANKHWERQFEIPKFGQFDFLFMMKGALEHDEFLEKTKIIRAMPRHRKYSLFVQHQQNLKKVHEKEFPMVFFVYDDIKGKGDRLYKRKKFRESVEHYTYAYGLLKWIEFKDKKRQEEFLKRPTLDPILDEDFDEKIVYLDDIKVEKDSYEACVVYLLNNLSYSYMELRHFSEAIDCLDEALAIAEDKLPDLYFRRSQARTYNKFSDNEELEKAMQDIDKAIELKDEPLYKEHKDIIIKINEERIKKELDRTDKILSKAKKSYQRVKDKNINRDEIIYTKKDKDALTQYKIIKE
jgi:tetratricopeptide (TPR) repeat protein